MKKIGIIGTNSAGKTTMCYQVLAMLKRAGVICDGTLQQDRRLGFQNMIDGINLLDVNPLAQWSILSTQIKAEADLSLGAGLEMLVSDRSPLDLYAYYENCCGGDYALKKIIFHWCRETFEKMYLLRPVAYEKTAARIPSEAFRDSVHETMIGLYYEYMQGGVRNIELEPADRKEAEKWRKNIPYEILGMAGKLRSMPDLSVITEVLGTTALIGGSYFKGTATTWSDLDIYVMTDTDYGIEEKKEIEARLAIEVEFHQIPNFEVWEYLKSIGYIETTYAR
jgi:hypothetical protein